MKTQPTTSRIARVVVVAPLDKPLDYALPGELADRVQVGCRVRVPLGRRQVVGYVIECFEGSPEQLKPVFELLDDPLFGAEDALFYQRAADYYAYPLGEAFRTALPAGLSGKREAPSVLTEKIYKIAAASDPQLRGTRQKEIYAHLQKAGETSLSDLRKIFPSPYQALQRLTTQGFLKVHEIERLRDPFARQPAKRVEPLTLNEAQQTALEQLEASLRGSDFRTFLLHGVTGSGKTEVYLRAVATCLELGQQALLMVPEIALTPQLVGRFRSWFAESSVRLAVLHSGLSDGERYDAWRSIARGDIDVVIGARSAVFAPLPHLGLVVVDEEHDGSYKQSEGFRYNARDLAQLRAHMTSATVLLGTATPALTTYHRALQEQITYLELPARIADRSLPEVSLVDLSQAATSELLSEELTAALHATLEAGEQALLLLNRRGYAPFLLCHDCGATCRCPNCEITLTFSMAQRTLRCHYCDFRLSPPETCDSCSGSRMMPEGAGTERLEEELSQAFPKARIARMDRDTTTHKGSHAHLLDRMAAREIDILVGTQMIAKGHDFANVTLVGVLNADGPLNLPDFRSAERVFALLSQMAGRAGRGERPGRVMIQTYDPDNVTLQYVAAHDYQAFASTELSQREALGYPPFGHLVNLVLAGNDSEKTHEGAERLARELMRNSQGVELLGPAPCLLSRLRGKSRYQILLKSAGRPALRHLLGTLPVVRKALPAGVNMTVDVDPVDMF